MPWFEHYFIYDQVLFLLLLLFVALVVFAVIFIFPVPLRYHFYLYQDVVFQDVLLTIPTIPIFFYYFSFGFLSVAPNKCSPATPCWTRSLQEGGIKERYLGYVVPLTLRLALGGSVLAWLVLLCGWPV